LDDPVSDADIKQQYRRLAMQHHPDRGGDDATLQKINAAMNILTR
ncbi:MAG: DnaJ domain-containing protein, partial [Gammaproteobacteria bacterium]|nr:DnaJ domain-containing protein [Gammaproteobacteria bacterium]